MSPINVLVIFSSNCGTTETLALAAAVGAVQARANIRLRRLTDGGIDMPECKETLARMRREYVPPAKADLLWADAVIIGMNGSVAGRVTQVEEATNWARQITMATREFKNSSSATS